MSDLQATVDDSELVALRALHIGLKEYHDGEGRSAEWDELIRDHFNRHGQFGILGLVSAMARQASIVLAPHINKQNLTPDEWLHEWTLHKLQQHVFEHDNPDLIEEGDMWMCALCHAEFEDETAVQWVVDRFLCETCETNKEI